MTTRKIFDEELNELKELLFKMCSITEGMIGAAVTALKNVDRELGRAVAETDREVDELEIVIEKRCMRLMLKQAPVAGDLIKVTTALKVITDIERIGDQASDIGEIVRNLSNDKLIKEPEHIFRMSDVAVNMIRGSVAAFMNEDVIKADKVIKGDDEMDELFNKVKAELIEIIVSDSSKADQAVELLMIAKYLEKIGDYAVNVSEWAKYLVTGEHKEYQ